MKLFFRKYGDGPPLILLHGLFGSSDNWVHIAREVSGSYTVYLPDLRNHGRSPWSEGHDYKLMAGDIFELADDNNLSSFFIAGHSMGGKTAVQCAADAPERILGLFAGDISPFRYLIDGPEAEQQRNILSVMKSVDPSSFPDRNSLEENLVITAGEKIARHILAKNIVFEGGRMRWRLNVEALISNLERLRDGFPRPPANITVLSSFPVIFLRGGDSLYVNEADINDIPKMFPGAHIITAPGAGHWIHYDSPDEVCRALRDMRELSGRE